MRDVRDYLEARLEVSRPGSCLSCPLLGPQPCRVRVLEPGWARPSGPATAPSEQSCSQTQSGSQPSDFSRPPLGSKGSTSTATSRAPSASATPLTSPSWAQAFKVALTPPVSCDGAQGATHLPRTAPCGWRLAGARPGLGQGGEAGSGPRREPGRWETCARVCCRAKGAVSLQDASRQRWGCLPL